MKRLISAKWHAGLAFRDIIGGPEMVVLPRGEFVMGFPSDDPRRTYDYRGYPEQRQQFTVQIDYEFAVGKYPVTFDQWNACVKDGGTTYDPYDPDYYTGSHPVSNVSWDDIQPYLRWLSKVTGKPYRLLSEAEWEYAARAGSQTAYSFGDDEKELGRYAWFEENSGGKTHPVGEKLPNAFDLYDMHGNVNELTDDCFSNEINDMPTNGNPWWSWGATNNRVTKGGSFFDNDPSIFCSAHRNGDESSLRNYWTGFRVARTD